MAEAVWFLGPTLEEPRQVEFMAALTRAAEAGELADADAAQTLSVAAEDGSSVEVGLVVAGLTCDRKFLAVAYEPGDDHGLPSLTSVWTAGLEPKTEFDDYDAPSGDDEEMWVSGVEATPTQCAEWAVAWWSRQLRRPVIRQEWDQPTSGWGADLLGRQRERVAVRWRLQNPEQDLDDRGTIKWWWLVRRRPAREVRERH